MTCYQLRLPGLIEQLLHTEDGKQYVTREQLQQDIQDEALVHGGELGSCLYSLLGRVSITELQQVL